MTIRNARTYANVVHNDHSYTLELAINGGQPDACTIKRTTPGYSSEVDHSEAKAIVAAFISNLPKF